MSGPVTLQRETFELSREMEFFTERELTAQIGHNRYYWPVALLKELLDNALDACESADIAPVITADLQEDALIVTRISSAASLCGSVISGRSTRPAIGRSASFAAVWSRPV